MCSGDPGNILRKNSAKLTDAISSNLDKVAVVLFDEELIPKSAKDKTLLMGKIPYVKASELVGVLQSQLSASLDQRQYLIKICNVLKDLIGTKDLAITMLHQLGVNVSDSTQQGIVTMVTTVIILYM